LALMSIERSRPGRAAAGALLALTLAAALGLAAAPGAAVTLGQSSDGAGEGLLDALARVPASAEALAAPLSYVDYRAVESGRPGAAAPASLDGLLAMDAADDPAAHRWFAAASGIASGPSDLMAGLLSFGAAWPTTVGFDFFDIDRALAFSTPPASGLVLLGDFDPEAIGAAHAARDYTTSERAGHTLLCASSGCEEGLRIDLANVDAAVPFGGRLGRSEPLAVSLADILSSPDITTLEAMLSTAAEETPSLAADPAFRALAQAPADDASIIQATLLPGPTLALSPDLAGFLGASPDEVDGWLLELEALPPLPVPSAVALVDGAAGDEQVVTIALAYADPDDAGIAAESVAARLGSVRSLTSDVPVAELLAGRGLTGTSTRVEPAGPDGTSVAVVELRAPLASDAPDPDAGSLAPSSGLYRLLVSMVASRDILWLLPA
jgi:hypothetical protein